MKIRRKTRWGVSLSLSLFRSHKALLQKTLEPNPSFYHSLTLTASLQQDPRTTLNNNTEGQRPRRGVLWPSRWKSKNMTRSAYLFSPSLLILKISWLTVEVQRRLKTGCSADLDDEHRQWSVMAELPSLIQPLFCPCFPLWSFSDRVNSGGL